MSETSANPFVPASEQEIKQQLESTATRRIFSYGNAEWRTTRILWKPDRRLGIGPVRQKYYSAMFCQNPHLVFPFGNHVYLPEIGIARQLDNCIISPNTWLAEDQFLAERLGMLGISWLPIEQAIEETFQANTEVRFFPYPTDSNANSAGFPSSIEPRARDIARAAMVLRDEDKDQNIKQARISIMHCDLAYDSVAAGKIVYGLTDLHLRDLHRHIEWENLYMNFTSPDLASELVNNPPYSYSRFTPPMIRAIARTLFQEIKTALHRTGTGISRRDVPGLYGVIETVATFEGDTVIRKEFWYLVAAIVNHLAPTILGVPLPKAKPFSAEAVKKHCGRNRDQIANTFVF